MSAARPLRVMPAAPVAVPLDEPQTTPADVLLEAGARFGVTVEALRTGPSTRYLTRARRWVYERLAALGLSSLEIGPILGKDPSTVRFHLAGARAGTLGRDAPRLLPGGKGGVRA